MTKTERYLEQFERVPKGTQQPAWVFPLRKSGLARFAELGLPTIKQEDWRFTNVAPIIELPFKPALQPSQSGADPATVTGSTFGSLTANRLVFLNGHYSSDLSSLQPENAGVVICSLGQALVQLPELLERHLSYQAQGSQNPFTALNTAFFQDGGFVHVPPGKSLRAPVHLLFLSTSVEPGTTSHPRNLVIAERDSHLTVLESYLSTVDAPHFTNAVTELVVGEGAHLEHAKFQDESVSAYHIAAIHADLKRRSNFISHSIALGARLSRNDIRTTLAGEGVECVLNGLYLTRGDQLADHHMIVDHAQPRCNSHEYYNGILDGRSKGVFHGRILVQQVAQKTDAKQTNKNLLLSEAATVDTKPQLEIYADDVKCTHGATVGQLNDESVFYLRARGLDLETARRMLIHAFGGEIIDRVRHQPAREALDRLVWQRLEANPHVAESK
jgi:Fe-S cluster assembly protein SufD